MPEEFEGDLTDAVFWGADLQRARIRDADLRGVRITHSWVADVEIDAFVDGLVVNGVDVTAYVNERDPWYPLRRLIHFPTEPAVMVEAWTRLEEAWADTIAHALALPEPARQEQVDGEFSFVETVRHVVFAVDKWFSAPILGIGFDPIGLPNRGSLSFGWPGLEYSSTPTAEEALAVRSDRAARVAGFLGSVSRAELDRSVDVLENGPHAVHDCIGVVFEEAFWHNRYARRDLAELQGR